jgi:Fe-S-cluster containining protein
MWTRGHFWRSIKLQRRFRLRFLDLGKLAVKIPAGQLPDCEACTDICCTGANARVSLRLLDVARLIDGGFADHVVRDPTPTAPKTASWARREADDSVFHRVFPVLRRDATGTCAFLDDNRLCGVYPNWPLSCARYPYALDLQLGVIFYARGCNTSTLVPAAEAAPRLRALCRAVVDSYNERIKDVVMLTHARGELVAAGLDRHLDFSHWPL